MSSTNELDITGWIGDPETAEKIQDAFDLASDHDQITWLTENGKRIAAIVPVETAGAAEQAISDMLRTPVAGGLSRTPAVQRQHELEVAARAGLLSRKRQ